MLLCKGRGCHYRKTCRRYVLGQTVNKLPKSSDTKTDGKTDTWIDHCHDAKKFEKFNP